MRSKWASLLFVFFLGSSSSAGLGCSDCRVHDQEPIVYKGGTTNKSRTFFESSAPQDVMLHFPQGRIYQFYHGLGAIPKVVDIYLGFTDQLKPGGGSSDPAHPNNVSASSGNMALIEVWDEEMIQIRNDTCENSFYVRVVAIADPDEVLAAEASGGAGGAGGSDGASQSAQ